MYDLQVLAILAEKDNRIRVVSNRRFGYLEVVFCEVEAVCATILPLGKVLFKIACFSSITGQVFNWPCSPSTPSSKIFGIQLLNQNDDIRQGVERSHLLSATSQRLQTLVQPVEGRYPF